MRARVCVCVCVCVCVGYALINLWYNEKKLFLLSIKYLFFNMITFVVNAHKSLVNI